MTKKFEVGKYAINNKGIGIAGPHCRTIIGDDDISYFYDNTFYCEFCGQRLKKGKLK